MTSKAWQLGTTDSGKPGEAQFFDPTGAVLLDTSLVGGGISGGTRALVRTTLLNAVAQAYGAGGATAPVASGGARYVAIGGTCTALPGASTVISLFMQAPDGTWMDAAAGITLSAVNMSRSTLTGVDAGSFILLYGNLRLQWTNAWSGTLWMVSAS